MAIKKIKEVKIEIEKKLFVYKTYEEYFEKIKRDCDYLGLGMYEIYFVSGDGVICIVVSDIKAAEKRGAFPLTVYKKYINKTKG